MPVATPDPSSVTISPTWATFWTVVAGFIWQAIDGWRRRRWVVQDRALDLKLAELKHAALTTAIKENTALTTESIAVGKTATDAANHSNEKIIDLKGDILAALSAVKTQQQQEEMRQAIDANANRPHDERSTDMSPDTASKPQH